MKINVDRRNEAYKAIHDSLMEIRMELKLPANQDARLAEVEHRIWRRLMRALNIHEWAA